MDGGASRWQRRGSGRGRGGLGGFKTCRQRRETGAARGGGRMRAYVLVSVRLARPVGRGFVPAENGTYPDATQGEESYALVLLSTLKTEIEQLEHVECAILALGTFEMGLQFHSPTNSPHSKTLCRYRAPLFCLQSASAGRYSVSIMSARMCA